MSTYLAKKIMPRYCSKLLGPILTKRDPAKNDAIKISPETVSLISTLSPELRNKILFVWYPDAEEAKMLSKGDTVENYKRLSETMASAGAILHPFPWDSRWNNDCYMDGIHPNKKGNEILANIFAQLLRKET